MKRSWVIVISLIVVAALAGAIFWMISSSTQPAQEEDVVQPPDTVEQTPSDTSPVPQNDPNGQTAGEAVEVSIQNSSFVPSEITVKKGTTVTWVNKDNEGHNAVADSGSPAGGLPTTNELLNKDETYSFTFDAVGVFNYHCQSHPFMQGKVTVTE